MVVFYDLEAKNQQDGEFLVDTQEPICCTWLCTSFHASHSRHLEASKLQFSKFCLFFSFLVDIQEYGQLLLTFC